MDIINCMLLSSDALRNFREKLSFLPVSFSIGFPKETLTLLPINVGKGELIFNSSKP